ncbi:hypothetical protein [Nocardiopsis sp. CC223A]|uniref:hypothetical protein n=1 Tax=Nocardiopsis sp. CC223A TaxID=3044051 RepID=UPI00278C525A|nr:hypothetical protein [Nocardiopsis sp. CC223A]
MSRTSRTPRAPRAAAVVRPPSLLLLPLFVGAALAALWLLGAPAAQADTAGPLGLDTGLAQELTPSLDTGVGSDSSLNAGVGPDSSLGTGVAEVTEVTAPVTDTLGTVHRSLEERTESAPAVTEVGEGVHEGARRVVRELSAVDQAQAENLVAHIAATRVAPAPPETAPTPVTAAAVPAGTASAAVDEEPGTAGAGEDVLRDAVPALLPTPRAAGAVADAAPVAEHRPAAAEHDVPAAPKLSTGSAAPSGAGAPAVAGYLTVVPVTAPAADVLSTAVDAVHPVPAGAADDPTVSPD